MNAEPVIQQANEIALKFRAFPRERTIEGIRDHLDKFWERAMRDQLIALVSRGGDGLDELVVEAVRRMIIAA